MVSRIGVFCVVVIWVGEMRFVAAFTVALPCGIECKKGFNDD